MYRNLWAKRKKAGEDQAGPEFQPLLFHLLDVAVVVELMWQEVVGRYLRAEMSGRLGIGEEEAGKWLAFWGGLHDLGKASPAFQGKWREGWERLDQSLNSRQLPRDPIHHGILTTTFAAATLTSVLPQFPAGLAQRLGRAMGGHHGSFPRSADFQGIPKEQRGGNRWEEMRGQLCRHLAGQFHLEEANRLRDDPGHGFFLVLAGLVSAADWIGSNVDYFPFAEADLEPAEYARQARQQAGMALRSLGWLGWRPPAAGKEMRELFPAIKALRPLQEAAVRLAAKLVEPGLVILEAPMGEGKTEAAMYLADCWAARLGQRGCYFGLPSMATSNQMFGRVQEFLKERYPGELVNFQLLHGHASLSAEFRVLREAAGRIFAPSEIEAEEPTAAGQPTAEVVAAEWFTYRKRGLLAPFGVGTVDQVLLAVLKTRHFFVRLFGLAGKTVIIDEVHAYDAYMMQLLERLLQWLGALGCGVVLLSATLPGGRRQALLAAFARGLGREGGPAEPQAEPYPRLSWISRSLAGVEHFPASRQFSRSIEYDWLKGAGRPATGGDLKWGAGLKEALADGGCAAVICNTVARAQEVYRALKPFFPAAEAGDGQPELGLFHARYLYEDREQRESLALRRFGKAGDPKVRRPRRAVLVATQVMEQSLDVDFDLMVTDLAPVDLLLQRAGRLHRHERQRPAGLEKPRLWIVAPELQDGVPDFGPERKMVYDRHILLRTWLALKERQAVAIPSEVEDLVEAVYGEGEPPAGLTAAMRREWEESRQKLLENLRQEEAEARFRDILPPDYQNEIMEDRNLALDEDNPGVHKSLQAVTRLGGPSITAVCLYQAGGEVARDQAGQRRVNLEAKPSPEEALALLRRSVSLTHRGLAPWLIKGGESPSGWRKHPWLCRCRLIRLDENQSWRGGGYELQLHPEEGVIVTRPGKEGA